MTSQLLNVPSFESVTNTAEVRSTFWTQIQKPVIENQQSKLLFCFVIWVIWAPLGERQFPSVWTIVFLHWYAQTEKCSLPLTIYCVVHKPQVLSYVYCAWIQKGTFGLNSRLWWHANFSHHWYCLEKMIQKLPWKCYDFRHRRNKLWINNAYSLLI